REGEVDAPLALMGIHGAPDCLTSMFLLREEIPVVPWPLLGCREGVSQAKLVLATATMPEQEGALATVLQEVPCGLLILPRLPFQGFTLFDLALYRGLELAQRGVIKVSGDVHPRFPQPPWLSDRARSQADRLSLRRPARPASRRLSQILSG